MTTRRRATLSHYQVLDVPADATTQEIAEAAQLQDVIWGAERYQQAPQEVRGYVERRRTDASSAFEELRDPQRRRAYDKRRAEPPEEFNPFPLPEQMDSAVWAKAAGWMKENDVGTGFQRRMAYATSRCLRERVMPTDRQLPFMLDAWETAVGEGFDPSNG